MATTKKTAAPAKKAATKKPPSVAKAAANRGTGRRAKKAAPAPAKPSPEVAIVESMIMVRAGHHDIPLVSDPRCYTCQNPNRQYVERELLYGRSYTHIAETLQKMETGHKPRPDARALSAHVQAGHTPAPAKIRRQIMDRRGQELGAKILGDDSIVDHVTLNSLMIQAALETLMGGELELSASDINGIIKTRLEIEKTSKDGYETEVMEAALHAQMQATVKFLDPSQYEAYAQMVDSNPVLKAALQRARNADAIPGEVVQE